MKALFCLDPETAHGLSIAALKAGIVPPVSIPDDPRLNVDLAGIRLRNPVGLAAGYDKNGEVCNQVARLGFGFVEAGSITPRAQAGNPKPRIFRLAEHGAIINRLGFNNLGIDACLSNLSSRKRTGVVGVNVGANKDSDDRVADYVEGIRRLYAVADYFTANVSSPNTPGLRDLQAEDQMRGLLERVVAARDESARSTGRRVPVFIKIAPDLDNDQIASIATVIAQSGVDGVIISNTTLSRSRVAGHRHAPEAGGLSGQPLFDKSTAVLARMRKAVGRAVPIIGVGGIHDAATCIEKMRAGADAVQIYTGLVYGGPGLVSRILRDLVSMMDRDGAASVSDYCCQTTDDWASRPIPD